MWKVALALALLILAILAGWFFLGEEDAYEEAGGLPGRQPDELVVPPLPVAPDAADSAMTGTEAAADPSLPADPGWVLPTLSQSDPFVREQLAALGLPQNWLGQEELVRRLAVVIENAARGEYPRRQLAFLTPQGSFRALERDGRLYIDPASYARFDPLVGAVEAVDPRLAGRLLGFLMPLIDEALAELGATGGARPLMAAGLQRVLAVPVLPEDLEVARPNVFYVYADPALERLGSLQKLLLRTGPANVMRVQSYLRRLAAVMGVQPAGLAPL